MDKIKSLADLKKKKDNLQNTMTLREKGDKNESMVQIKVAMATCGIAAGAKQVMETLIDTCDSNKIDAVVTQTGCMGYCFAEPTVEITKPGQEPIVFGYVNTEKAKELVTKYIMNNELLEGVIPQNYQSIDKQ
ncbi:MAG: (2Fe-2S) ferredoxin domain-containing protein [Bacteroidales bacterium]|jgi:NADP-reducing hydrogenase subunit HndB|nr:(2Fe-2S) ferredoxin domain-containing protein [Bacteroidales bacterium]MBR4453455.1 (2Fe-2S) ferredoxin domain-containing protein [Bacteroidales bacterium]MCR5555304.1 (2Fe-2S) ferredoxin domain-containing protein [Bacteroidales bacterium]